MAVGVGFWCFAGQLGLERMVGLAEIVKQRRHARQQANLLARMPVVLVVRSQHVARVHVGRRRALRCV